MTSSYTPSRIPLQSLVLDSSSPHTDINVTTNMKTPMGDGKGGNSSFVSSGLITHTTNTKRKRETEHYFHTKRLNKSPINEFMNSNTSVSLKSRVRTLKKIDSIARAWINSGNDLLGLQLHQAGELLCSQNDKIILFSGVQTSNVISVDLNTVDDFDTSDVIATISTDEISSRKYLVSVDGKGNVLVRSLLINNTVSNTDDPIAACLSLEGENERFVYVHTYISATNTLLHVTYT